MPTVATADYPALTVRFLSDAGPGATNGTWVDITDYVASGTTSRGRTYATDQFDAGTCSVVVKTTSRIFDPEFSTGPYYGNLLPMRQLEITSTWSGTTYSVFRGYIRSWGNTVQDNKLWQTTITAQDAFCVLEQIKLPSSAWALEVQKDDPSLWFRLGETDTPRVTDSSAGGNYGLYDNVTQGVEGLVVNDADAAVEIATSIDERVTIQNPALISGYPFTVSAMAQHDPLETDGFAVLFSGQVNDSIFDGAPVNFMLSMSGGASFEASVANDPDYLIVDSTVRVDDGKPHHLAVSVTSGATASVYVDGVDVSSVTFADSPTWIGDIPRGWQIGNAFRPPGTSELGFGGIVDEFCVWDGEAITSGRIAAHALAALTGWEGDDTGTRADRFLDVLDWPATLRDIDTGISILGPASWSAGSSALSVMQAWAATELGAFFIGKDGKIVWRSRHYPLLDANAVTSQATFGDGTSGAALQYLNDGFSMPRDETLIRNPVTASRRNGISVTVKDTSSIETFGDRTWAAPNSEDQLDSAIRDRALWLLARYKGLSTRLASLKLFPRANTALWPHVLGRELGDRITVKRTPLGTGNEITSDQIIERIEHSFAPLFWETTISGSPVDPNVGDYLILDDATYGELDAYQLAY